MHLAYVMAYYFNWIKFYICLLTRDKVILETFSAVERFSKNKDKQGNTRDKQGEMKNFFGEPFNS